MKNKVFDYIENLIINEGIGSVSFHSWGSDENREKYLYLVNNMKIHPVMEYNGNTYLVTEKARRDGMGGMDQGSPDTITFKLMPKAVKVEDEIPLPLDEIDVNSIIEFAKSVTDQVRRDKYANEDNDHYAFETIMKAVYGKDYFEWYNRQVK